MPRPRFDKLPSGRRDAILDAALKAFASHGFDGASYNQIIQAAGVSKGAMYYYFDDKEDLFITVVRRELEGLEGFFEELPPVASVPEYWAMLSEWMVRFQRVVIERPHTLGLFRQILRMKAEGARHPGITEIQALSERWTQEILRVGQRVGAVRTDLPVELIMAIVQAVDDAGDLYLVPRLHALSDEEVQRWSDVFVDLLRRILCPKVTFSEEVP